MADKQPAAQVQAVEAGTQHAGKLCSICQTAIITGERVVACPHCALPFHAECWAENRGCSAYGCEGAPKTVKQQTVEPLSNAWGGEKPCPSCGRTIKAQALKCRFCGASFETRDVITKDQFASREYEGKEYVQVRNKIVFLFLLSAAGCLAPLGLIFNAVLVSQKSFWGIDYRRVPASLRAVALSAIGISGLLLLILALLLVFD